MRQRDRDTVCVECCDVDMTEPAGGWWPSRAGESLPAGVLIRGGCTSQRREERRASVAGDHGPVTPASP